MTPSDTALLEEECDNVEKNAMLGTQSRSVTLNKSKMATKTTGYASHLVTLVWTLV